jgi:hypothetical protein
MYLIGSIEPVRMNWNVSVTYKTGQALGYEASNTLDASYRFPLT